MTNRELTDEQIERLAAEAETGYDPAKLRPRPSFTCPDCGRTSHNPNDARERYCGACHTYFPQAKAPTNLQDLIDGGPAPTGGTIMTSRQARQILELPMGDNDADAATVRDYLITLLRRVWVMNEEFSGKYPFGNSDWQCELYGELAEAGLIDRDENDEHVDEAQGDRLILAAIDYLAEVELP